MGTSATDPPRGYEQHTLNVSLVSNNSAQRHINISWIDDDGKKYPIIYDGKSAEKHSIPTGETVTFQAPSALTESGDRITGKLTITIKP